MNKKMNRVKKAIVIIATLASISATVIAACHQNQNPSYLSHCLIDRNSSSIQKTTLDEDGNAPANTWCLAACTNDITHCRFETPYSSGCTPSGSYSNVWLFTQSTVGSTCEDGSTNIVYNFGANPFFDTTPTGQGETQKFIIDMMNCD